MTLTTIPHDGARIETGPLQVGDDWPGLFIRGDDALGLAFSLRFADASPIYAAALPRIIRMLESCNVDAIAKAIEAQRAETVKQGSVEDESAVANGDLPTPSGSDPQEKVGI